MFRNSPEVDGGGTAYLGPTIIIEMTISMSQSSSGATLDDSWFLAGPINDYVRFSLYRLRLSKVCVWHRVWSYPWHSLFRIFLVVDVAHFFFN